MKLITVSGPTAAGKDTLVDAILAEANRETAGNLANIPYYTTRKILRPGEVKSPYHITEQEFEEKVRKGELLFWDQNADYRVGTAINELGKNENQIINVAPQFVENLRKFMSERQGKVFSIALTAPKEQRIERIRLRESWLFSEPAEHKVEQDIAREGWE